MHEYVDEKTGAKVLDLTPDMRCAQSFYQTHPMWTKDMEYLLFSGGDSKDTLVPCARLSNLGKIGRLLDEPVLTSVLDPENGRLYYLQTDGLYVLDVAAAFRRMASSHKISGIPPEALRMDGGVSLDARGDLLYAGAVLEEDKRWAIFALNVATEKWQKVIDLDFRVGHIQANPVTAHILMFCHETGGDAPQRTWTVRTNGTDLRPFYRETYDEWVTHETWWGGSRALFTIWPYDEEHKQKPHGVAGADFSTGALTVYSQFPAWHTHGSPDGKWIVADDFDRNIWLIKAENKERRLLTQGHLGKGLDTHPHPSFTPDSRAVLFNSSQPGNEHLFLVKIPDWESLPNP